MKLLVKTQFGLGDCIYHRPFIKQLAETHDLYIETSWPELFIDLDVKFCRPTTTLRTQNKNISRQVRYVPPPSGIPYTRPSYAPQELLTGKTMLQSLAQAYSLPIREMDLPKYSSSFVKKNLIWSYDPLPYVKNGMLRHATPIPYIYTNLLSAPSRSTPL